MKEILKVVLYQPLYNLFIFLVAVIPGHNVGVAIILLTFLMRAVLMPLRHKAIESQAKQQSLQPELKKLQEQYKDDRQGLAMAQMQMYKDKGVSPTSGCLPTIVQLVLLIVLYRVFLNGLNAPDHSILYPFVHAATNFSKSFLWIHDLTKPDHLYIFPVLAGLAQLLASRSMMSTLPQSSDPNDMASMMSKQMMYLGPVSIFIFALRVASGLSLYWIVASLLDWYIQHQGIKRFHNQEGKEGKVTVSVRAKKGS